MIDVGIAGRTAYITGGAHGIGLATAKHFLNAGAVVVISDIAGPGLQAARDQLGPDLHTVPADLANAADVAGRTIEYTPCSAPRPT